MTATRTQRSRKAGALVLTQEDLGPAPGDDDTPSYYGRPPAPSRTPVLSPQVFKPPPSAQATDFAGPDLGSVQPADAAQSDDAKSRLVKLVKAIGLGLELAAVHETLQICVTRTVVKVDKFGCKSFRQGSPRSPRCPINVLHTQRLTSTFTARTLLLPRTWPVSSRSTAVRNGAPALRKATSLCTSERRSCPCSILIPA